VNRALYWLAGVALLAVLAWVTRDLLTAQRRAQRESDIRAAHFRMNSRVALLIEQERARSPREYEAFPVVQSKTFTKRNFQQIEQDELLEQSALLEGKPEFIRLHFLIDGEGRIRSPQVPQGLYQEIAVPKVLSQTEYEANCAVLDTVQKEIDPAQLGVELTRAQSRDRGQQRAWLSLPPAEAGTLEPLWIGDNLYFVRRVERMLQGFLVDWPRLRDSLLDDVDDLFPDARLVPHAGEADDRVLYALPAKFVPGPAAAGASFGIEHVGIALMWGLVLFAFGAYGRTLQRAERQRRFASHVTHELRSPLTTFSLYSDLLAEGLLKNEEKKGEYLRTLQSESQRMGHMIENVIAQARLEEGRTRIEIRNVTLGNLVEEVRAGLERGCAQHGKQLTVDLGDAADAAVRVDRAAVERILTNLVENACKYGGTPVSITAAVRDGAVKLRIRDHGEGVAPEQIKRIFKLYDRGGRNETDAARGLGLGLPLSRELARRMGGDLTYEAPRDGGACFVVSLPTGTP